jgi:hypothetical protein
MPKIDDFLHFLLKVRIYNVSLLDNLLATLCNVNHKGTVFIMYCICVK